MKLIQTIWRSPMIRIILLILSILFFILLLQSVMRIVQISRLPEVHYLGWEVDKDALPIGRLLALGLSVDAKVASILEALINVVLRSIDFIIAILLLKFVCCVQKEDKMFVSQAQKIMKIGIFWMLWTPLASMSIQLLLLLITQPPIPISNFIGIYCNAVMSSGCMIIAVYCIYYVWKYGCCIQEDSDQMI